ncbi:MAG TPA: PLP-dependent transferase [Chthoniobacterales bacterium]|nr:PLP-dependent transferase [Chthoniobacterales bacterium]
MTRLLQRRQQPNQEIQTDDQVSLRAKASDRDQDEREFLRYFTCLADGLDQELRQRINRTAIRTREIDSWNSSLSDFRRFIAQLSESQLCGGTVADVIAQYEQLARKKGCTLNNVAEVARAYESMDAFWNDVSAQSRGDSSHTYWDTYEHGRRRQLEHLLAQMYGSEDGLLLNSGMSGIAVVCEMLNLRPGDTVVTGERSYFEITDFLDRFVSERGIRVVRVPVGDFQKVIAALQESKPRLVIIETVTNVPSVDVPENVPAWLEAAKQALFLIDNSVQSHLTCWFSILPQHERLIILESGVKYLAHHCMAGILYGNRTTLERARNYARVAGQQLQEKAFNFINVAETEHLPEKLARHTQNVRLFHQTLQPYARCFSLMNVLDSTATHGAANTIFDEGIGALLFVALPHDSGNANTAHRRLLDDWRQGAAQNGLIVQIRCGFGWNQTTARVYESGFLNQPDAPTYLRVSVGIEPQWIVRSLAETLGKTALAISQVKLSAVHTSGSSEGSTEVQLFYPGFVA